MNKRCRRGTMLLCICGVLLMLFSACTPADTVLESSLTVAVEGGVLALGMPLEDAKALLGEPSEQTVLDSCAGEKKEYMVYYPSVTLYAYSAKDVSPYLCGIRLNDDAYACAGVRVGDSMQTVETVLGDATAVNGQTYFWKGKTGTLCLTAAGETVEIVYIKDENIQK